MSATEDITRSINEPKTARMEQRTKPQVKAQIQAAAALLGMDETTFVTTAAFERARATLERHERTVLDAADRTAFLAALGGPAGPTDAMAEAIDLHRRTVAREG